MNIEEFKKEYIKNELEIDDSFGKIFSFIDFGNVTYWFKNDTQDYDFKELGQDKKLTIDIEKLRDFTKIFSQDCHIYYGKDPQNSKSKDFISVLKNIFGDSRAHTKEIQRVRHYLTESETLSNTREVKKDGDGDYVFIPKCNFDVEVSVDAMRTLAYYDTICLWSGDADFAYLLKHLKTKGKKVILIKSGHITKSLKDIPDKIINAQSIKSKITKIESKKSP